MATLGLTSTRGILTEKTVNTLGNSGQPPQLVKEIPWPPKLADARIRTTNKRRIDEVDTPELAVTHLRPRIESVQDYYGIQILEDADGPSHKASWSSEMFESNTHCCLQNPAPSSINMSLPTISHHSSEINDTDSQKSCMSSLINFDPEDETIGSQQTAATEVTQPERSVARAVENLRLRLRVAMFKVQTNQASIPMSQLQISPRKPLTLPSFHLSPAPLSHTEETELPKLLPAPVLRPTAYSSRTVTQTDPPFPAFSSNTSPQRNFHGGLFQTPALPRPSLPQREGSSTDSPKKDLINGEDETNLPSSVVKGRAADGLLGLMHARV
ncbi:hypothetical protein MMC24_003117 [Lignoscripta atroalba]|nr:hypothetical protein [Lignoscripta atroalba]